MREKLVCNAEVAAASTSWSTVIAVALMIALAIAFFIWMWKLSTKMEHAWIHMADVDLYASKIEDKVNHLRSDVDRLAEKSRKQWDDFSNELSMTQDHIEGVQYGLVENGGFVRNIMGLTME